MHKFADPAKENVPFNIYLQFSDRGKQFNPDRSFKVKDFHFSLYVKIAVIFFLAVFSFLLFSRSFFFDMFFPFIHGLVCVEFIPNADGDDRVRIQYFHSFSKDHQKAGDGPMTSQSRFNMADFFIFFLWTY